MFVEWTLSASVRKLSASSLQHQTPSYFSFFIVAVAGWTGICVVSILLWILSMAIIYYAIRYRSYLPHRRVREDRYRITPAKKEVITGREGEIIVGETATAGDSGKESQLVSGKEAQTSGTETRHELNDSKPNATSPTNPSSAKEKNRKK